MLAHFISLSVIKSSMLPRLQFDIEITNETENQQILIFGWSGGLFLQYPQYLQISDLSTGFECMSLDAKAKNRIRASCEVSQEKLDIIEGLRNGENLEISICLNILNSIIPKTAQPPYGINQIRYDSVWAKPVSGEDKIVIPRSIWDDRLEELNYGTIMTLRFTFPPPPLGTQLDKSVEFIKDAQKKINDGEWADSLVSCRKSIDELQKVVGNDDEKRKVFFESMLSDGKKAEACEDLWQAIQKAKNFASGGPHTYWVKTADKRDAELAIRVVSAFVNYFTHNLARASAS